MKTIATLVTNGNRHTVKVECPLGDLNFDVSGLPLHLRQRRRIQYVQLMRRLIIEGDKK